MGRDWCPCPPSRGHRSRDGVKERGVRRHSVSSSAPGGAGAASGSAGIPAGPGKPVFRHFRGAWKTSLQGPSWLVVGHDPHTVTQSATTQAKSAYINPCRDPMEKAWLPRPLLMGEGRLGVQGAPTVAELGPQPGFKCRPPSQAFKSARCAWTWRQLASPRAGRAPSIGRRHRGLDLKGEMSV